MKNTSLMLSISRLALLPFFIWQFLQGSILGAVCLLTLSGAIGLIQGFYTRKPIALHSVSEALDPVVDKLTQAFAAILLAFRYPAYWWTFIIIMGKELMVLALGTFLVMHDVRSERTMWVEKTCVLLLYIAMAPLMLHLDTPPWVPVVSQVLLIASAVISTLGYLADAIRVIHHRHQDFMRRLGRKNKKGIKSYGIFSIVVIPLCTIAFASKGNPLAVNLSIIGNQPGHRFWFVLWGALCAVYFVSLFIKTFHVAKYTGKVERCLMVAAGASFIACVLTPYLPDQYPIAARWHNVLAVSASALIILVSFLLSLYLRKGNRKLHRTAMWQWAIITCICVFLILATGISGLFEVVLIISVSLHTYYVLMRLTKEATMH